MSLKSKTFEKLEVAVDDADASTENGVKILALVASAVKNLNDGTDIEEDVYQIGVAGELGFGVATCASDLIPSGWRGLVGHDNIISPNYGNYVDSNGSILVYIPKHYYKYSGNTLDISHRPLSGFVIDRSFINAGAEINGIFVYKYGAVNSNGIFASKKNLDPLSTSPLHNPIGNLNGSPANENGGLYEAVKTAGAGYCLTAIFHYSMLARLAFVHGKAATTTIACAYSDVNPKLPKGNLANSLADVDDTSVTFSPSVYPFCALTGSGEPFAKTTHNGQDCGIADLNGNMWEVASGFIRNTADFLILRESTDILTIDDDSTSGGAYDASLYDVLVPITPDTDDILLSGTGWTYLGDGAESVFAMNTSRTTSDYKRTALGIPKLTGVSGSGTTEFGKDGIYKSLQSDMSCIVGGNWGDTSDAGVFAMMLYYYRTSSGNYAGGRASYLV